ncbi:MAG: leucine-rich repeat protein [Butyricicoccus sp.]
MQTMEQRLHSYEPLFGGWMLQGEIGAGSYARVYRVVHRDPFGMVLESALKAIEIIPEGEMGQTAHLETLVREQYIEEVNLLGQLRGISNIVSYEDHMIVPIEQDGKRIGYDLLIRMELLDSLDDVVRTEGASVRTESGVRKLGMDLCRGLSRCHRVGILHRDIKPKNIFRNQFGDYKLGDFGIARHFEGTMYARTRIGTELYAAPEITDKNSARYGARADLYSLGLVLYQQANSGWLPFITAELPRSQWKDAVNRRNRGDEIPLPGGVSEELGKVIVKACAFRPEDRFGSAQEMYYALQSAGRKKPKPVEAAVPMLVQEKPSAIDRLWSQIGLSVVLSPDAEYMKRKLEQTPVVRKEQPEEPIHDVLDAEQADKLPPRRLRLSSGRGSNPLIVERYREIANWAFRRRKDLTAITCRAQVRTIGEEAFADCSGVQGLTLEAPLTTIGAAAFLRCTKIPECILPDTVESIGERAFQDCISLRTVTVPEGVFRLPAQVFSGCRVLSMVSLPAGLEEIGMEAFRGCAEIVRFALPAQLVTLGARAFSGCRGLQEIQLPSQLQTIPESCFIGCTALHTVKCTAGLRVIEDHAFRRCSALHALELPYGLERIGSGAFQECEELSYLKVPDTVVSIGEDAFGTGGNRLLRGRFGKLTVVTTRDSYVWSYCRRNGIRVQEA